MATKQDGPSKMDPRFGQRLRELRLAQNLTQGELAKGRYTASYISAIERGKVMPTLNLLRWCAARLDRSLCDLLGEPDMTQLQSRRAREERAQAAYAQVRASMQLAEGDVSAARDRFTALRQQLGAVAPATLPWFIAYAAFRDGDIQQAATLAADYLGRAHADDDRRVLALWHWLNGLIHTARGETHEAVVAYRQAVTLKDEAPVDPDFSVYVLRALADVLLRAGAAREAHQVFGEAADAYERFADPRQRADESLHLAQIAAEAGQYVNAYMLAHWAWICRRESFVQRAAAGIYLSHALLGFHTAPEGTLEQELRRALALAEGAGDDEVRALAASFLAVTLARQGRDAEAELLPATEHPESAGSAAAEQSPRRRAAAALAEGWLAHSRGQAAEALASARAAAAALREIGDPQPDLAYDFAMLADLCDALGEHELGLWALRRATELLGYRDPH